MDQLSFEEINRYSRQLMLASVSLEGQLKIKSAKVLVIGAGGLGCPILQYLAGAGVGTIGIVDFDTIEIHNLHRQVLYATADIGKKKAIVAAEKLKAQNPNCTINVYTERLSQENAPGIIEGYDVIIDGTDNFLSRYTANDICVQLGKPLVYGSILNFEGQLAIFNYIGSKNLRDLYPEAPDAGDVPSCSENGVLGIVPGIVGTIMCSMALQIILGFEVMVNTLMVVDLMGYGIKKLRY